MGGGSSRSVQSTASTTTQTSENLNVQDVEGVTIVNDSGDVHVVQTDHNAIGSATQLAETSVAAGRAQVESSNKLTAQLFSGALDFASAESGRASLAVDRSQERAYEFNADFASGALDFVRESVQKTQDTIGNAVGAILQIGKEQNTSTDQRVGDIAAQSQKNTIVLVGIVGVAVVAIMLFKGH